jgi:tagaturonate reductase
MEVQTKVLTKSYLQTAKPGTSFPSSNLPVKVLQVGEGNFMRGFIDWMIYEMNQKGVFNGRVAAIQPTPRGKVVPKLNRQDCLYTLIRRGIQNGEAKETVEVIDSIATGINPYTEWEKVLMTAESEDVEFVFSNTTEAGIAYHEEPFVKDASPLSYPGKLVALLYHRYLHFDGEAGRGWTIIPCELVEKNGEVLKAICSKLADYWNLGKYFWNWVEHECTFCNTLVDRIVTGYPWDKEAHFRELLGYEDVLMTIAEHYALFVIDGPKDLAKRLPFREVGLNVHFDKIDDYRELKVKLLNAPHTILAAVGTLAGIDTVRESIENESIFSFIDETLTKEICTTLPQEERGLDYVKEVYERFLNPYLHHKLLDISLNGYAKFGTRVAPSILQYREAFGVMPERLLLSLAALVHFYRVERVGEEKYYGRTDFGEYEIRDSKVVMEKFMLFWEKYDGTLGTTQQLLMDVMPKELADGSIVARVAEYVHEIDRKGMKEAMKALK